MNWLKRPIYIHLTNKQGLYTLIGYDEKYLIIKTNLTKARRIDNVYFKCVQGGKHPKDLINYICHIGYTLNYYKGNNSLYHFIKYYEELNKFEYEKQNSFVISKHRQSRCYNVE